MMDLTCSPQSFCCPSKLLQIPLIFLFTVTCLPTVTELAETKEPLLVSGEIGGEVTFRCPFAKQRSITFFYFQKGNTFVNGYHVSLPIPNSKWENTRLDSEYNVHMNQLNSSHAGKYTCHIHYADMTWEEIDILLSLTANYTKPNVTISYSDHMCKVTCTSHGGYPKNKIDWDVHALGNASSQMSKFVENPPDCDMKTKQCNISSTATFNCSFGLHRHLSCYIYNTEIFSTFPICDRKPLTPSPPLLTPDPPAVPIAVSVVVILSVVGALVLWKIKKGQTGHIGVPNVEEGQSLGE